MRNTLKPLVLIVLAAFAGGSPLLDDVRPEPLKLPLRGFHEDVRSAGATVVRAAHGIAALGPREVLATATVSGRLLGDVGQALARVSAGQGS